MFDRIIPFDNSSFNTSLNYLWVLHADKIPPHVGISSCSKYFSLKYNGKDENLLIESLVQLIQRKGIKSLAIQLNNEFTLEQLKKVFLGFEKTFSNEITCLAPIEKVLDRPKYEKLESLLKDLEEKGELGEIFGFNVDESYTGIPFYTELDIHKRLQFLEDVDK